jgi:hypothetical protein
MRIGLRIVSGIALLCAGSVQAQSDGLTPDEMASVVVLDSVSIPTPGEFFAALNKVERPNWIQLRRDGAAPATTNRAQTALAVGTRVADGFIAVEAQDGQQVRNIGKDIIELSKKLGVSQSILARGNSISDFAENNDWSALREELDATENEVKLQMIEQKDTDLITLVTIGAWLRGLQVASEVVSENYKEESAALLRQPAIAEFLLTRVDTLPDRLKNDELVGKIREGLVTIRGLVKPDYPPIQDTAATLHTKTTELLEAIGQSPAAPAAP